MYKPKEYPILFKPEMVWAIRAGRKTMTRRLRRPRWVAGDRLWIRETWQTDILLDSVKPCDLCNFNYPSIHYVADGPVSGTLYFGKQRPSIFMPRWVSRDDLEVVAVREEKLCDISETDAQAEGILCLSKDGGITWKYGIPDRDGLRGHDDVGWHWHDWQLTAKDAFIRLWDSINGKARKNKPAKPWSSNPTVYVTEFKRMEQEQ